MSFTLKFMTYWRNVKDGRLSTPLNEKKGKGHREIFTAQGDNSKQNKCAQRCTCISLYMKLPDDFKHPTP